MWTLQEINETKIRPEEITYLVTEMGRLQKSGEKPGFETAAFILFKRYEGMPDPEEILATKTFCIMERMRCLSTLSNDERMHGWTRAVQDEEWVFAHEAIFRAAALCPVKERDGEVYFDANDFFDLALKEVPAEGEA